MVHALRGEGKFVGPRDGLDDDVLCLDTRSFEGFEGAVEQGGDEFGVPARVNDAYAEGGAWQVLVLAWTVGGIGLGGLAVVFAGFTWAFERCHGCACGSNGVCNGD